MQKAPGEGGRKCRRSAARAVRFRRSAWQILNRSFGTFIAGSRLTASAAIIAEA
jgi:hypothetical protein